MKLDGQYNVLDIYSGLSRYFGGLARFVFVISSLLFFIYFSYQVERSYGLFSAMRYILFYPFLLFVIILAGARYIQLTYGVSKFRQALHFLLFGLFFIPELAEILLWSFKRLVPHRVIGDPNQEAGSDDDNLIKAIGGGIGYLNIYPGYIVLLENFDSSLRVLEPGWHFIARRETIKEIVNLEEQDHKVDKMNATTKDGIPIIVKDVRFRFRLAVDENKLGPGSTSKDPFPFSEEAVKAMVYNRTLTTDGVGDWIVGVKFIVDSAITDYISQHSLDELTAPPRPDYNPRDDIEDQLKSNSVRDRLMERGTTLIWSGVGHFEIQGEDVAKQRGETWQARWVGDADIVRAYGESQLMAYRDLGRAEAQAELLMSIVHALESIGRQVESQEQQKQMQSLYLARIAQLLDSMHGQGTRELPP